MLSKKRKKEIERLAEKTHRIVMRDSVDSEHIGSYLASLNIDAWSVDLSDQPVNAYVTYNLAKKKPIIFVDSSQTGKEMIFSAAHEIAHLVLDWGVNLREPVINESHLGHLNTDQKKEPILTTSYRRSDGYKAEDQKSEEEADYFAACFLVPRNLCISFLKKYAAHDSYFSKTILRVSGYFAVDEVIARKRIDEVAKEVWKHG